MSSTKNRRLTETPVCYKVCCMCSTITYVITLRHTQHKREIHLTVTVLNVFFCNASWICSVIMILSHRYLNNESTVIIHFRCKLRLLFEKQFSRKAIQMSDVLWLWSLCRFEKHVLQLLRDLGELTCVHDGGLFINSREYTCLPLASYFHEDKRTY